MTDRGNGVGYDDTVYFSSLERIFPDHRDAGRDCHSAYFGVFEKRVRQCFQGRRQLHAPVRSAGKRSVQKRRPVGNNQLGQICPGKRVRPYGDAVRNGIRSFLTRRIAVKRLSVCAEQNPVNQHERLALFRNDIRIERSAPEERIDPQGNDTGQYLDF